MVTRSVVESAAGVVPVTRVDAEKDMLTPEWVAAGPAGSPHLDGILYGRNRLGGGVYSSQTMAGLPVGVQVVGPQLCEEKVLQLMRVVDDALGPRGFGPGQFVNPLA